MIVRKRGNPRARFTVPDDLILREVRNLNPFDDPLQWNVVVNNLHTFTGKPFTARAIQERCERLTAQHISDD
ncbi:hypothetical protein MRX96_016743 [Rhipicephalus microplus]